MKLQKFAQNACTAVADAIYLQVIWYRSRLLHFVELEDDVEEDVGYFLHCLYATGFEKDFGIVECNVEIELKQQFAIGEDAPRRNASSPRS